MLSQLALLLARRTIISLYQLVASLTVTPQLLSHRAFRFFQVEIALFFLLTELLMLLHLQVILDQAHLLEALLDLVVFQGFRNRVVLRREQLLTNGSVTLHNTVGATHCVRTSLLRRPRVQSRSTKDPRCLRVI